MLESAVIVMTVMGCGDLETDCDFIKESPRTYATVAECDAAIQDVLLEVRDAPYPVLSATCDVKGAPKPVAPPVAVAAVDPQPVSDPAIKRPSVDVGTPNTPQESAASESDGSVMYRLENGYAYVKDGTVNLATRVGDGTMNAVSKVGEGTKNVVSRVGDGAAETFNDAKDAVVTSTKKVRKGVSNTLRKIGETIDPRQ